MSDSGKDKLREVFSKIGKGVQVQAEITRLRLRIKKLQGEKKEIFEKMGEKVYDLYPKGLVKNSTLLSLCQEVAKIDEEIRECLERITELTQKGETPGEEKGEEKEEGIEEEVEE